MDDRQRDGRALQRQAALAGGRRWRRAGCSTCIMRISCAIPADMRPMAASREAMEDLKRILAGRSAFYSKAELHFNTSDYSLPQAHEALAAQVKALIGR